MSRDFKGLLGGQTVEKVILAKSSVPNFGTSAQAKINNLNAQEKFQKAIPGARRAKRGGCRGLARRALPAGFEISFKSTATRQHYKTSQDQHFEYLSTDCVPFQREGAFLQAGASG
ncbi:MAG: hypothetical protein K2N56_08175 [Oscillospiraceae bacterium]|nr:hypothetical protein [Oscillospiraceae bacterium]